MMYLPYTIPKAQVLITVKTYPLPSRKYGELVCTAGLLDGEKWIRIYPVPYRFLKDGTQYPKYGWVELDLVRNTKDFRPESYRPQKDIQENIRLVRTMGTKNAWEGRKSYVLREVFTSMKELIALAKSEQLKSLATLKPSEIVDFVVESDEREWKEEWRNQLNQMNIFDYISDGPQKKRRLVRKLPYKFYYRFLSEGDDRPRKMMIEDWEIGALYWNTLRQTGGDEEAAIALVREKYFETFVQGKDLYFFVGTTLEWHRRSPNPFVIIGVFYPPISHQLSLFG